MPTYTVTATHTCLCCGIKATVTLSADMFGEVARPCRPDGWLDFAWPSAPGRILVGELCGTCVAAVAAFIRPSKE